MSASAVEAVALDVDETLFSLARLRPAFDTVGLEPDLVPLWFARVLRDGFALTVLGGYRPFADLAGDALRGLAPDRIGEAEVDVVLDAFRELDPCPDVEPALRLLRDAGIPAVTLTNGSADLVAGLLRRVGLDGYLMASLSVDAVRRWKPAPEPYRYAADQLGVDPSRLALIAAHAWDCAGAHAAGLRTGWLPRAEPRWPDAFPPPDVTGDDLPSVVAALLNRPATE
jgi:2-haloacid dehalogenase